VGVVQSHGGTIDALNDTINDSFVSDPDLVVNWGLVVGGVGSCLLLRGWCSSWPRILLVSSSSHSIIHMCWSLA